MSNVFRVRVEKITPTCNNNSPWYGNSIGECFDVEECLSENNSGMVRVLRTNNYLLKSDVSIIDGKDFTASRDTPLMIGDCFSGNSTFNIPTSKSSKKGYLAMCIDSKEATYIKVKGEVTYTTSKGVTVTCAIPKDWAITRVCQFMESLLLSELN